MSEDAAAGRPGHTTEMTTGSSRLEAAEVRVWHAGIDLLAQHPAIEARAFARLGAADLARYGRFRHDIDRRMFLLGRAMARVLVGRALGRPPLAWTWREGPRGRPEVGDPGSAVRFNVAHSAGLVVCALVHGREVGVDAEHLDRRPPESAVVERYCSPDEIADIRAWGDAWCDRFLVYWTLKEAYLKARGLGIAVPLAEISFTVRSETDAAIAFRGSLAGTDDRWAFTLARPTPRHLVAVAASTSDGDRPAVAFHELDASMLEGL